MIELLVHKNGTTAGAIKTGPERTTKQGFGVEGTEDTNLLVLPKLRTMPKQSAHGARNENHSMVIYPASPLVVICNFQGQIRAPGLSLGHQTCIY